MRTEEAIRFLGDKEFLDKLYGYAYKRCSTSHEAEDLCSDILLAILKGIRRESEIKEFYAFAWTVAHRVYADFSEKRKQQKDTIITNCYSDDVINIQTNDIDAFIKTEAEAYELKLILREIAFLSKIYRDVMVLYYLDEMKTAEIAEKLGITETAVKQRLFSARNTIRSCLTSPERKGVKMDTNYTLQPVDIAFIGTGNPVGNDPRTKAERVLSKNIVYLCKNTARSAKEISELLNIPMLFVEDELELQCRGENGSYGLLRKLDNGKYISNIILLDIAEYETANKAYTENLDEFCERLKKYLESNQERILSFPFLNRQKDNRFITWSLISRVIWALDGKVNDILNQKYLADINVIKREFSTIGFAFKSNETLNMGFYGCDGNDANNICGYSHIHFENIYGKCIEKHCACGHNISTDPQLMMTIRAVGGLELETLTNEEKEIAAKAIECGYIEKSGNTLYPKILVLETKNTNDFYRLASDFTDDIKDISEKIAEKLSVLIKNTVPPHLINEYPMYSMAAGIGILNDTIEKCIEYGILNVPENRICAEGSLMILKK